MLHVNLLNRQFDQKIVDNVWVTDITYITCSDGRLYLNTYLDLTTCIPRCFKIYSHMRKSIVMNPLIQYQGTLPEIIHSDCRFQCRFYAYQELLEDHQILHSMSEPGTPVDNAVIESYHRSIKRDLIIPNKRKAKVEMKVLIYDYLTDYYHNR